MANLPEQSVWTAGIYQLEEDDDVAGGPLPEGMANLQPKQLADRTKFLKVALDKLKAASGSLRADMVDGEGRDLLTILGVSTIAEAMAEIRRRCNNNGEIDASKVLQFGDIMIGDYIDGIDLSGLTPTTGGTAPQAWNNTYKNNRIVVAGFNTYKGMGSSFFNGQFDGNNEEIWINPENDKNHILFVFRNVIAMSKMNQTNTNSGGYRNSELRSWLEGQYGLGDGVVAMKLKQQLGGEYLYTISKLHSEGGGSGDWQGYTLWIPSEIEIFGIPCYGDEGVWNNNNRAGYITPIQIPLYQRSYEYRIKRRNGSRSWYWTQTPYSGSSSIFCYVNYIGYSYNIIASAVGGCAPAFCVA